MKVKILTFSAAIFMASCASTGLDTSYLENLDQSNSAKIRLASGDKGPGTLFGGGPVVTVYKYSDEACNEEKTIAKLRNGPFGGAKQKSLDIPLNDFHKNAATETYLEAGQTVNLLFHLDDALNNTTYKCGSIVTAIFEPGKQYELSMDIVGPISDLMCKVDLNEITSTDSGSTRTLIRTYNNDATGANEACLTAFSKSRWL